jgi:threonine/homoserine/homoserine lactone efflux protein
LKQSIRNGLKPALWTAFGIGCGIFVHVSYVVFGVAFLLRDEPLLFKVVQWGGAAYLCWLAWPPYC